jgi:nucleoside phosphorylase
MSQNATDTSRIWVATLPFLDRADFLRQEPLYLDHCAKGLLLGWRLQVYCHMTGEPPPPIAELPEEYSHIQLLNVRTKKFIDPERQWRNQVSKDDVLVLIRASDDELVTQFSSLVLDNKSFPENLAEVDLPGSHYTYQEIAERRPRSYQGQNEKPQLPGNARVLIVTALPKEAAAVLATMHAEVERPLGHHGDPNIYKAGTYMTGSGHLRHVLVATQAAMGKANASSLGADALRSFPEIEHVLMVGIAGGCPNPRKPEEHVRLGDVVVSNNAGIIEYDNIKQLPHTIEHRSTLQRPSAGMLRAHNTLLTEAMLRRRPWEGHITNALPKLDPAMHFERPVASPDILHDGKEEIEHPQDPHRREGGRAYSAVRSEPRTFSKRIRRGATILVSNDLTLETSCTDFSFMRAPG